MAKKLPIKEDQLENILSIINPPDSSIYYYGVRHHSPISSCFLLKALHSFKPELILIELPPDAEGLILDIANEKSVPPLAIHNYYTDDKNSLGYNGILTAKDDLPLRISSWYPLTEFSPEYIALKQAAVKELEVHFIDLPLENRLKHEKEIASEKSFFQKYSQWSERYFSESSYVERLVKKSKMRDFNEFWNHNYEVNAIYNTLEEYLKRLYTFAYSLRYFSELEAELPTWKTILERENYMARNIQYYIDKNPDKKIFVVTGALHAVALPFMNLKGKLGKIPKKQNCTLAPFSYRRVSNLSGYMAGIQAPYYQHLIWEELISEPQKKEKKEVYNETALNVLINVKNKLKDTYNPISTADIINAFHMGKNLASLRSRHQISLEDLNDSILSSYVKGQVDLYGLDVLKETENLLIGTKVGKAYNSSGNPLQKDFYQRIKKLRLPKEDKARNVRCEIHKRELHRVKSQFLHKTVFLNVGYAKLTKGPDFVKKENLELLIEQWTIRWTPSIDDSFPKLLPYGTTMDDVAKNLLNEKIAENYNSLDDLLNYLLISLQMGFIDLFEQIITDLNKNVNHGQDFNAIVKALSLGILLLKYRTNLIPKFNTLVENFVFITYSGAISKLKDLIKLPKEEVPDVVLSCKMLNQISLEYDLEFISSDILVESIKYILNSNRKIVPRIEGAFIGILYSHNEISELEVVQRFKGRILSNEEIIAATEFLTGLFLLNKTILMTSDDLLETIHENLMSLEYELFLEILPGLRSAFTALIPREIDYISSKLAKLIGIKPDLDLGALTPEALRVLKEMDSQINSQLKADWGL